VPGPAHRATSTWTNCGRGPSTTALLANITRSTLYRYTPHLELYMRAGPSNLNVCSQYTSVPVNSYTLLLHGRRSPLKLYLTICPSMVFHCSLAHSTSLV